VAILAPPGDLVGGEEPGMIIGRVPLCLPGDHDHRLHLRKDLDHVRFVAVCDAVW
jgi:hypothetical protein